MSRDDYKSYPVVLTRAELLVIITSLFELYYKQPIRDGVRVRGDLHELALEIEDILEALDEGNLWDVYKP